MPREGNLELLHAFQKGKNMLLTRISNAPETRRRHQEEEMLLTASSPARDWRISLPRATWDRVVAFLQGWAVALPFPTFRRRMFSAVLPLSNYTGRACF